MARKLHHHNKLPSDTFLLLSKNLTKKEYESIQEESIPELFNGHFLSAIYVRILSYLILVWRQYSNNSEHNADFKSYLLFYACSKIFGEKIQIIETSFYDHLIRLTHSFERLVCPSIILSSFFEAFSFLSGCFLNLFFLI